MNTQYQSYLLRMHYFTYLCRPINIDTLYKCSRNYDLSLIIAYYCNTKVAYMSMFQKNSSSKDRKISIIITLIFEHLYVDFSSIRLSLKYFLQFKIKRRFFRGIFQFLEILLMSQELKQNYYFLLFYHITSVFFVKLRKNIVVNNYSFLNVSFKKYCD